MHLVKFLTAYGVYSPGEVAGFSKEEAEKLKKNNIAEDAPKPARPAA